MTAEWLLQCQHISPQDSIPGRKEAKRDRELELPFERFSSLVGDEALPSKSPADSLFIELHPVPFLPSSFWQKRM